ncbi:MAG: hypothetical protein ACOCNC_11450 [Acetivibrio ethanolgignens]
MVDWNKIEAEYITTMKSYRELCKEYGVTMSTLREKGKSGEWVKKREQWQHDTVTKFTSMAQEGELNRLSKIFDITDKALDKIAEGMESIDIVLLKNKKKTKVIEYDNSLGKPKKEVVDEIEEIEEVRGGIDALALRQLIAAVKDIKDIQMLMSDADKREQEARIKKLESGLGITGDEDDTGVVLMPSVLPEEENCNE